MLHRICVAGLTGLLAATGMARLACAADWLPINPDDLKMTSEPLAPGAPAIILYRQDDRSDSDFYETVYDRIKILTADGLKYANVEIPFVKGRESIGFIRGRTIEPNGDVVEFDGKVFERPILQQKGVKVLEKTFTLPAAQVGSIIEYRYQRILPVGLVQDSHLIISQSLFTRDGKFSLEMNPHFGLQWSWPQGLPAGSVGPTRKGETIRLEVHDVPAFVTEDHMPPPDELKYRMDFIYRPRDSQETDPARYWRSLSKSLYRSIARFTDERRAMSRALSQIVQPGDSPEEKLRKIYARVERIHNVQVETAAQREADHEDLKKIDDVADVWKRGYGGGRQITWLFLALVRAAGLQADPALVSTRDRYFFNPKMMDPFELDASLVIVTIEGRPYYFEPGIPFTRFGLLPWSETAVPALRLSRDGGQWITTPLPAPSDSRIERKAVLQLDEGTLSGKLTVTYTGLEASWRRMQERNDDETARRKFLEDDVQGAIPTGAHVKLINEPAWSDGDQPLVAEFDLSVPGWVTPAGRHALLPLGLFGGAEAHVFEHAERVYPVYFDFPYEHRDDVTITLPQGWSAASVPAARDVDLKGVAYASKADASGRTLHLTRDLTLNVVLVSTKSYDTLRQFFQTVRLGDEDDVVLSSPAVAQAR